MTTPGWLTVGAEVVEYLSSRHGSMATLTATQVERIGKRDVVLANGSRYNVNRLRRDVGSTWDPSWELLAADDERVARASAANRRANDFHLAYKLTDDLSTALRLAERGQDHVDLTDLAQRLSRSIEDLS